MVAKNSNKIFRCGLCEKVYYHEKSLTRHVESNHYGVESKVHTCDICKKKFRFEGKLSKHVSEVHIGTTYKCKICDRIFTRSYTLRNHVLRFHKGKREVYSCENCDYVTHYKFQLSRHKSSFHEQIKFQCDECPKKYSDKRILSIRDRPNSGGIGRFGFPWVPFQLIQKVREPSPN